MNSTDPSATDASTDQSIGMTIDLARRLTAEALGTGLLIVAVIGSGIMASRLSPDDVGLQLLENAAATAGALIGLIFMFGAISGAHFNPAVTLVETAFGDLSRRDAGWYIVAQTLGGCIGAMIANLMFELPAIELSTRERSSPALWVSEVVATIGLLLVIHGLCANRPGTRGPVRGWDVDRRGLLVHLIDELREPGGHSRSYVVRHLRRYRTGVGAHVYPRPTGRCCMRLRADPVSVPATAHRSPPHNTNIRGCPSWTDNPSTRLTFRPHRYSSCASTTPDDHRWRPVSCAISRVAGYRSTRAAPNPPIRSTPPPLKRWPRSASTSRPSSPSHGPTRWCVPLTSSSRWGAETPSRCPLANDTRIGNSPTRPALKSTASSRSEMRSGRGWKHSSSRSTSNSLSAEPSQIRPSGGVVGRRVGYGSRRIQRQQKLGQSVLFSIASRKVSTSWSSPPTIHTVPGSPSVASSSDQGSSPST